jgi:hypothetical protein
MNLWKANFTWLLLPNCDPWSLWCKVVNIIFTPLKNIFTFMNYWFMNQLSTLPWTYFVIVCVYPSCTCPNFVSNTISFRHSYFLSYKHMYYICNVHLNLVGDLPMHQPSLNCNDVKNILKLDPFEPFCAIWLHIWEYNFKFMVWNFQMLTKCSWIFGFQLFFM